MFNDEIDSIRINSLNSVTNMGTNIQLNDEQVKFNFFPRSKNLKNIDFYK